MEGKVAEWAKAWKSKRRKVEESAGSNPGLVRNFFFQFHILLFCIERCSDENRKFGKFLKKKYFLNDFRLSKNAANNGKNNIIKAVLLVGNGCMFGRK